MRSIANFDASDLKVSGPDAIAPDGSEIYFRVLDASTASMVEVSLPAGGASRPVRHRTVEEIWYFLAGSGEVWRRTLAGEEKVDRVFPGSVVTIPTGWSFQFRSDPAADLRFLCYTSPPWPGEQEAEPVAEGGWEPTVSGKP